MAIIFKNKRKGISGKYEKEAEKILKDREKMQKLISKVLMLCDKLSNIPDIGSIKIGTAFKYVPVACLMIKDYMNGDYRAVPLASILTITGAFLYLVSPVNIIPNTIPGVGVIDDVLVVTYAINAVCNDIESYWIWKCSTENEEYEDSVEV